VSCRCTCPRDFDADLRKKLTQAGHQGGFVLLVGDSSVGKTRALFEAVRGVVPDWWLLHPRDAEGLREFAAHPAGRTVVWLDELQDCLDFAGGPADGTGPRADRGRVVLVATCWPGEHSKRVALPENGRPDTYANDQVLITDDDVRISIGRAPIRLPNPIDALARTVVSARKGHATIGATSPSPWLFPGGQPGRPISTERLKRRLNHLGIRPSQARSTALFQLATEIPAAVLARTLGISVSSAVRWQQISSGDWTTYAAEVSHRTSSRSSHDISQ
ncbi:hypothetical protein ACGFMK_40940, partial [Amycolatopsis sp. NPDC049252]